MLFLKRFLILTAIASALAGYDFPDDKTNFDLQCEKDTQPKKRMFCDSSLEATSNMVAAVVRYAEKALVFITVKRMVEVRSELDLFEHFFGDRFRRPSPERRKEQLEASASGFFVDLDNGYIVTNAHVVKDSKYIQLTLANGEIHEGQVVGMDDNTDIAIVRVGTTDFNRDGLDYLELTGTAGLRTGEFVVALGAPFGLRASASLGIVSGLGRGNLKGFIRFGNFIQTDAAINPGNSGGPLLNARGEAIGVNSAIYSVSGGYNGVGFAVPAEIVKQVSKQLIESGKFTRGYMGISPQQLEPGMRSSFHLEPHETGVLVSEVVASGPAAEGGLQAGDVILAIDGQPVATPFEIANTISFRAPGTVVEISYVRDGKRKVTGVKLVAFPAEYSNTQSEEGKRSASVWGLKLEEVRADSDRPGVGILVLNSDNLKSDIYAGDIILAVDNIKVEGLEWFANYVNDKREVVLYVKRKNQYLFVTLRRN